LLQVFDPPLTGVFLDSPSGEKTMMTIAILTLIMSIIYTFSFIFFEASRRA
jgi:hypothetical protein